MLHSFVGIADRFGLESLLPENPHVVRFLCRRATLNRHRKAVCYWAVIQEEFAQQIAIELQAGCRADALILLQSLAAEMGPVFPTDSVDEVSFDTA